MKSTLIVNKIEIRNSSIDTSSSIHKFYLVYILVSQYIFAFNFIIKKEIKVTEPNKLRWYLNASDPFMVNGNLEYIKTLIGQALDATQRPHSAIHSLSAQTINTKIISLGDTLNEIAHGDLKDSSNRFKSQ